MTWEHIFAFAQNGTVYRYEPVDVQLGGSAATSGPKLPMSVAQYISELGANDGYEFAGSYPKDDGVVIVMKRQRGPVV
jgi:hypothetical protein